MNQEKIGAFIASCRKEHNMTQVQFAEQLGITNKAVSKWETGKCLPDAVLFDDICILLDITLNELFAGEKIAPENIEKKAEENLISMAVEYQKRNYRVVISQYITILLMIMSISVNISVGGTGLEGWPVFSNLFLTVAWIISLGIFSKMTHNNILVQRALFIFSSILVLSSTIAFILTFWDFDRQIIFWLGLPSEVLFYGLKMFCGWIHIYAIVAVLSFIGIAYFKNNIRSIKVD